MPVRSIVFVSLLLLGHGLLCAQTTVINSLKRQIRATNDTRQKLEAIFALCDQGYSLHSDTLMAYAVSAEAYAKKLNDPRQRLRAKYYKSFAFTNNGLIDSSMALATQCLAELGSSVKDAALEGRLLNQIGRCYMRKNQYKEAIEKGQQVIARGEMSNDVLLQMQGKTLIGWAFLEMEQTGRSLQWHLKALRTTTDTEFIKKYSILFANIALNYNALGKRDSAFYFIDKAIAYSRMHENLFALSNSLAIHAQLLVSAGKPSLAENPLKEVVEIRKQIGDPFYIVSDMAQLGLYYANNGQPEKGIAICQEGIEIATRYNIGTKLLFLYSTLADNYREAGDETAYAATLEKVIRLKDSVYLMNSEQALAEIQTKYELQRKENTIIQQKLYLARKNYWIYGSLMLLLLAVAAVFFIFKNYRKRQELKMLLMVEKEKRTAEKAVVEAEENERKRIAADLHDNLGVYAAAIAANLDNISVSSLDKSNVRALKELRNNSQSIVSQLNDTIWVLKKDALLLTSISDRLKSFIQRIQSSYSEIKMDVHEQIENDHLLPPSQAFHLFQVLKEAVNNAIRHSRASEICVFIESNAADWKITVADNGKGMSPLVVGGDGNGVHNMKKRSDEVGWEIAWRPNTPTGTKLTISPTTN